MVKDRLEELKMKNEEFEKESLNKKRKKADNMMETSFKGFQLKVHNVEEAVKRLRNDVADVKKTQNTLYCSPFVTKTDLQKMENAADQILTDSINIRKDIQLLAAESTPNSDKSSLISSNSQARIHLTQIERLSGELRTIMNDFRTGQADYLDKTKARYQRQMQIVNNGNSDGLDSNFENKNMDLFTGGILAQSQKAKDELQDLYEREKELHDLEGQIVEVNKLFKDIHALVGEQGEMIDSIEANVETAVGDVESGKKQLGEAEKSQSSARRKKIMCGVIGVVILLIVIAIVAVLIANNSSE